MPGTSLGKTLLEKAHQPPGQTYPRCPTVRQDACTTWGMGGHCARLNFWWQIPWEALPPEVLAAIRRGELSINVLELVAVFIGYAAAAVAYKIPINKLPWQPMVRLGSDNKTAEYWYKNFTNLQVAARNITKLFAFVAKHSDVGANTEHLPGRDNHFADALSRGKPKLTIPLKMGQLTVAGLRAVLQVSEDVTTVSLSRFQPGPALLSAVVSALLPKKQSWALLPNASSWGQLVPESNITFTLSETSWEWTTHI
jgi:hypothetical protein